MSHSISLILSFFYFRYKLYSDSQKIPNTRGLAPMLEQICLTAFTRRRVSMPSRAYTSFLHWDFLVVGLTDDDMCQCPLGLIPHFYLLADLISPRINQSVNALSGLYLISTPKNATTAWHGSCVNALSGLYLISTWSQWVNSWRLLTCQCPLGLIPHFYELAYCVPSIPLIMCQCPLGLIPHFYMERHCVDPAPFA